MLAKCLASLASQTLQRDSYEVIVCDDGSDEDLEEIVRGYRHLLDVRSLRQSRAGYRIATARNLGIAAARGRIVVCLDADVLAPPAHLTRLTLPLWRSNRVATFGLRRFIDATDVDPASVLNDGFRLIEALGPVPSASARGTSYDRRLWEVEDFAAHPFPFNCFHGCNAAFIRSEGIAAGGFDERFNGAPGYEDIEFGSRLHRNGVKIHYVPEAVVYHQENALTTIEERAAGRRRNREYLYDGRPALRAWRIEHGLDD